MEKQVEKLLTVLMHNVIEGIPNGKGGFFEQPVQVEAAHYLEQANQVKDAAVSAAARKLLVEEDTWPETIWKNTLVVLVGSIPLVGSSTAFYPQFERLWKQLRFIAASACIYGHDVQSEATQCQIVLCLVDEKLRNGKLPNAMDSLHTATRVAASTLVRGMAVKGGSSAILGRALGGLLAGVVPGVVSGVYNVMFGLRMSVEGRAKAAQELVTRVQDHFKVEDHQAMMGVGIWFGIWLLPTIVKQMVQLDQLFLSLASRFAEEGQVMLPGHWRYVIHFAVLACIVWLAYGLLKVVSKLAASQPWLVSTTVLAIRGFLHFASARSVATSALVFLIDKNFYFGHKMFVGAYSILSRQSNDLKPWLPYVQASFLIWVILNLLDLLMASLAGFGLSPASLRFLQTLQGGNGTAALSSEEANFLGAPQIADALDVVSTLAMISLVDEIRKPEVIVKLLGPKQVVDGLVFAARRLGTMISKPKEVLNWLDETAPSPTICCVLVAARRCSLWLGFTWGVVGYFHMADFRELILASYAILATVTVIMWQLPLPEPIEHKVWSEALTTRHRLIYLIPDVQPKVLKNLYYALEFFETYEKAVYHTSISILSSKEWVGKSWNQLVGNFLPSAIVNLENQDDYHVVSHDHVISDSVPLADQKDSIWARSTATIWGLLPVKLRGGVPQAVPVVAADVSPAPSTPGIEALGEGGGAGANNDEEVSTPKGSEQDTAVEVPSKPGRVHAILGRVPVVGRLWAPQMDSAQSVEKAISSFSQGRPEVLSPMASGNEGAPTAEEELNEENNDEDLRVDGTTNRPQGDTNVTVESSLNHEEVSAPVSLDEPIASILSPHVENEKPGWVKSTISKLSQRLKQDNSTADLQWFRFLGGIVIDDKKLVDISKPTTVESAPGWLGWLKRKNHITKEDTQEKKNSKFSTLGLERNANETLENESTPQKPTQEVSLEWFIWLGGKLAVDPKHELHDSELPPIVMEEPAPKQPSRARRSIGWLASWVSSAHHSDNSIADLTMFTFLGGEVHGNAVIDITPPKATRPASPAHHSLAAWAQWVTGRRESSAGRSPGVADLEWFEWAGGKVDHDATPIHLQPPVVKVSGRKRQMVLKFLEKAVSMGIPTHESKQEEKTLVKDEKANDTKESVPREQFHGIADLRYFVFLDGHIAPPPNDLVSCKTEAERKGALANWFVKLDTHPERKDRWHRKGYREMIIGMLPVPFLKKK